MPLSGDDPEVQARVAAFRQTLQDMGWNIGRNVRIEYRWGAGGADRNRRNASELVGLAPDVILATGSPGHPHSADRVRAGRRSRRRGAGRESVAAGRQRDWFYHCRLRCRRKMV